MTKALKLTPIIEALKLKGVQDAYSVAFALGDRDSLFTKYGIDSPLRIAHFLAQVLHETGGLTLLRENMNYSAKRIMEVFGVNKHSAAVEPQEAEVYAHNPEELAERVYGLGNPRKSRELGNTDVGDGYKYRGGGPLQITGRGAYLHWGARLGVDFVGHPDLIVDPKYTLLPSLCEWEDRNCNVLADKNNIRAITKAINGGYNGYEDRVAWLNRVWEVMETPTNKPHQSAFVDSDITQLQKDLNELGAKPPLKVDGKFGPETEKAVRKFQLDNGLAVDGIAGDATRALIKSRLESGAAVEPTATKKSSLPTAGSVGGGLASVSYVADQIINKVADLRDKVGDNETLQIALTLAMLFGIALVAYGFYTNWRHKQKPIL